MGVEGDSANVTVSLTLRPAVPMGYFGGVPFVCALAVCETLREKGIAEVGIAWPYDVVAPEGLLAEVRVHAGYDDEGMFAACDVMMNDAADFAPAVEKAVRARVDAWAASVCSSCAAAGPLASVLSDLFDAMPLMGASVEVVRAGRSLGHGLLGGMDVWGRVTVHLDDGRTVELSPEQGRLRPVVEQG